jgi:phage-related baseplate assembly protein
MSYTLAELTTPLTADEVEAAIYAAVEARGAKTTAWKPGAVVRTIIAGVSIVLAAFSSLIALVSSGGFLSLASGDWLTLLARYVFGLDRIGATFATGTVTLTNTSATPYSGGAADLIVQNSTTGAVYRSTEAWSLDAAGGPDDEIDVAVKAAEAGSDSTSPAGDIDALVTTLSGVTVTNAAAVVGTDEEDDDALETRCLERTGALSPNGPKDAYGYAARNAVDSDGNAIGVTRVATQAVGDGTVNVWVATASGEVTGDAGDPETDLGAIAAAIYEQAEPLAVDADVDTATSLSVAVTYELWIYTSAGLTEAAVEILVEEALTDLFAATPIGGHVIGTNRRVYVDDISAAIDAVHKKVFHVDVTAPAADVGLSINHVPVLGTVNATVNLVAGGDL